MIGATMQLYEMIKSNEAIEGFILAWWHGLYVRMFEKDADWDGLDGVAALAIQDWFKREEG